MPAAVVITGLGMVTPLGSDPAAVLRRIEAGESSARPPAGFEAGLFGCPVCAAVDEFQPQQFVAEAKLLRLMNRDAQLAVAAAHLALRDAKLVSGRDYAPGEIALFGATGLAGLPLAEVAPLARASTTSDGRFDPRRFGQAGLRAISPLLSFKILANMPVCFVSICENIQGPNAIYTPWEGQGAQAIESGARAIRNGDARCAVVGGCDVKTHELAFINLEQEGLFRSWRETGAGVIPGEGAAFLVLEDEAAAKARGARMYVRLAEGSFSAAPKAASRAEAYANVLERLVCRARPARTGLADEVAARPNDETPPHPNPLPLGRGEGRIAAGRGQIRPEASIAAIVAAGEDGPSGEEEAQALAALGLAAGAIVHPKQYAGNLFAAAAALQVAVGALLAVKTGGRVLANCFGHGSEQAAFLLESP